MTASTAYDRSDYSSGPLVSGLISSLSEALSRETIAWADHWHPDCAVDRRASQASKLTGIGLISWVFKGLKFRSCYLQRQVAHAFVKELFSTYLLRLAVPHEVGTGRRPDRVAGPAVGAESPANLGGDRRGLCQAAVLEAGAGCGRDGDQPAAVRCGLVVVAGGGRSRPEAGSRPAAEVRQEPDRPGQTRRADAGLADRAFLPLRSARSLSEYLLVLSHGRWISLGFGLFGLGPTLCAHYPPQSTPTLQERRQIFKRLWVKHISCHSADTFSRPRNRNLRIPRADLIMPNTGSTMCLRAA